MSEQLIAIVPSKNKKQKGAVFNPSPLSAQQNDVVCWNNTTNETHQPWPSDSNDTSVNPGSPNYLSDPIPPDTSSSPSFVLTKNVGTYPLTINYFCASHPERTWERGTINAQAQQFATVQPETDIDSD